MNGHPYFVLLAHVERHRSTDHERSRDAAWRHHLRAMAEEADRARPRAPGPLRRLRRAAARGLRTTAALVDVS